MIRFIRLKTVGRVGHVESMEGGTYKNSNFI